MPTRIQMDFSTMTLGDYDAVTDALNFPADWPDGLIAHGAAEVDGRLRVVDVWESSAQHDRFVEQRLQAAMGSALGDRAERPERTDLELHSFYTRPA